MLGYFKIATFLISLIPTLIHAMEHETLSFFHLSTDKEKYSFRQVDFNELNKLDYENFVASTHDSEAVKQMFGTLPSWIFGAATYFNPSVAYEAMVEKRNDYKKKDPDYPAWDWFVEDTKNSQFVGHITLFGPHVTPSEDILSQIKARSADVLEMGAAVVKEYRGKHIVSQLAPLFLEKLREYRDFDTKYIFLYSRTDNSPVRKIAQKNNFESYGSIEDPFDFGLFTMNISANVYVRKVVMR